MKFCDYAVYHFDTEEKYFDQFGYSEAENHKDEHKNLLEQVTSFKTAYDEGKTRRDGSESIINVDLYYFLKDGLINHIQISDRKYVPLFKERGL